MSQPIDIKAVLEEFIDYYLECLRETYFEKINNDTKKYWQEQKDIIISVQVREKDVPLFKSKKRDNVIILSRT